MPLFPLVGLGLECAVFLPIPKGEKAPRFPGWQNTTVAVMSDPAYLARFAPDGNVGVLLGAASGHLCVIDIDDDETVKPFLALNPRLAVTLRTHGARGCSLWVYVEGEYPKTAKLKDGSGRGIMEWRADGHQSVIHGIHPKGHAYQIVVSASPIMIRFEDIHWPESLSLSWKVLPPKSNFLPKTDSNVLIQARAHVAKMPPAISGDGGHDKLFAVACALIQGFDLSEEEARLILDEYNIRCSPRWSEKELAHKLADAERAPDFRSRGHLRDDLRSMARTDKPAIRLPGHSVPIREAAEQIFSLIAPTYDLFYRGGAVCGIVSKDGKLTLEIIRPSAFRSRVEAYGTLMAERVGRNARAVWQEAIMAEETARALLDTEEARRLLPAISGLINCPVLRATPEGVKVLGKGYDPASGLFVTGGEQPPKVPLAEAIASLESLLSEFAFATPGDHARAVASLLTPALKLGGHITAKVPADVAEADQSQSGKTYRQRIIAALYNEIPATLARRDGGVGSIDESFAQQLVSGVPFIQIDNLREGFNSQYLEAFLTADKSFSARIPHAREISVNPDGFFIFLTSNGVQTTRDFANRSSIIRIRKREGYAFREFPQGDLLAHVRAKQPYYLGCVFAVIEEWIERGRMKTLETRHDFREWVQTVDSIVRDIFGLSPVMEGHLETQERISNPASTFLRELAVRVAEGRRFGESFSASALRELCEECGISIPGLKAADEAAANKQIGVLLSRVFGAKSAVTLDEFEIVRTERRTQRADGEGYKPQKVYQFSRIGEKAIQPELSALPHPPHQAPENIEKQPVF